MKQSTLIKRVSVGAILATFLGLAACDRQEERVERGQTLAGDVWDQITGQDVGSKPNNMADVSVEARAFAGVIQAQSLPSPNQSSKARYVIGSIVAKPRDLPPPLAMASVMAEPEMAMDVIVNNEAEAKIIVPDAETMERAELDPTVIQRMERPELRRRSITVVDPRVESAPRPMSDSGPALPKAPLKEQIYQRRVQKGLEPVRPPALETVRIETPEQRAKRLPQLDPKLAKRAMTMQNAALARQLSAEDRMIEAASKYKVAASIQRSRSGQMVIEIGSDAMNPTSFQGALLQQASVALDDELICDEAAAQMQGANPLVAMECVIQDLQASGEFEYVEKDYVFEHQMIRRPPDVGPVSITPNDPLFGMQWHYLDQGVGENLSPGGAGFVEFWTREGNQGSNDVVVAVVDTGLEMSHPDIKDSPNVAPGWDMVSDPETGNDGDGRDSDPNDPGDLCPERNVFADTFHGTHVAGIVGAGFTNNSSGVAGGAWNVKIVPVRALGKCGGRLSDINDAIRWSAGTIPEYDELGNEVWNENPADIINLSIGLFKACPASMQDAIDEVTAQGVIVVAAAGNDMVPTEYYAPAGCRNVLTVAGGDARGYIAPYSNYGDAVDILAPGGDLGRDDNGDGHPDGVLSTKSALNCSDPLTGAPVSNCHYAYEQGTSMATPHVSAALALIKSKRPDMTATELVDTLMSGVSSIRPEQCRGDCSQYPGSEPTLDDPDICYRPCGAGQLNLAGVTLSE